MPDYQAIVEGWAGKLGAKIVDIRTPDLLFSDVADEILSAIRSGLSPTEAAFSDVATKTLYIVLPVTGEWQCMIAMHELGHIATTPVVKNTGKNVARILNWEATATQWALDHVGFTISPETARLMEFALESYKADPKYGKPGDPYRHVESELHALQRHHMLDPEWVAAHAAHEERLKTVSNQYVSVKEPHDPPSWSFLFGQPHTLDPWQVSMLLGVDPLTVGLKETTTWADVAAVDDYPHTPVPWAVVDELCSIPGIN